MTHITEALGAGGAIPVYADPQLIARTMVASTAEVLGCQLLLDGSRPEDIAAAYQGVVAEAVQARIGASHELGSVEKASNDAQRARAGVMVAGLLAPRLAGDTGGTSGPSEPLWSRLLNAAAAEQDAATFTDPDSAGLWVVNSVRQFVGAPSHSTIRPDARQPRRTARHQL